MKFTVDLMNKIAIISVVVVMGMTIGTMGREQFIKEPVKEEVVQIDTLPLKNGGEIILTVEDGRQFITISYKDFKYIRKGFKKTLKNVEGLFARME